MTKTIHENSMYKYLMSSKEIIYKDIEKEKILFNTKKTIRLIEKNNSKALFYVLASKQIILLDFDKILISQVKLKGDITRIKYTNKLDYLIVFENFPKRIAIFNLQDTLKLISEKSFKELGLRTPKSYAPRIDFDII